MKKHTNLDDELDLHQPRIDWVPLLVTVVVIIALSFCVYLLGVVGEVAGLIQ